MIVLNKRGEYPKNIVTQMWGKKIEVEWPNMTGDTPPRDEYPIRCIRNGQMVKFESGDPNLLKSAGPYFQKIFNLQRKYQALYRKNQIKEIQKCPWKSIIIEGFYFCYPQPGWKKNGWRIKSAIEIMKWPFQSIYSTYILDSADLGIARSGDEMDQRIRQYRRDYYNSPDWPTERDRIERVYQQLRYVSGQGRNRPSWYANNPPKKIKYVPLSKKERRKYERFSQYSESDSENPFEWDE